MSETGDFTFGRIGFTDTNIFTDTFERSDRDLDGDRGWQSTGIVTIGTTTLSSTRQLEIQSGNLVLDPANSGAGYAWRSVRGLEEVRLRFQFASGTTDNAVIGVIISNNVGNSPVDIALNSVHIVISPAGRQISFYDGAIVAASDTDTFTLSTGTEYEFVIRRAGGTSLQVTDPDGGTETITNSGASLWGDTMLVECLHPTATLATDKLPQILSVVGTGGPTGLDLKCSSWSQAGDVARVEGVIRQQPTVEALLGVRDQLQGYGPDNTDEPVVPVTWEGDPSRNGFYRVQSCEVSSEITGRPITTSSGPDLAYRWEAELLRVPGWKAPILEVTRTGALRTNNHSFTNDVAVTSLPGSLKVPRWSNTPDGQENVSVEGGSIRAFGDATTDVSVTYALDPASFYEGASRIEVSPDEGVTWQVVTGRQVDNLPGWVRMSNGRVRVTCSLADAATLLLAEVWDATADEPGWEECAFNVTDSGSPTTIATYTHPFVQGPIGICSGPDGNLWVTTTGNNRVWKVTPGGSLKTYLSGVPTSYDLLNICTGADGNLWFTVPLAGVVAKMTTSGDVTSYNATGATNATGICAGPSGNLWVTSYGNDRVVKVTTAGVGTVYTDADLDGPTDICLGPDGLLWVTSTLNDKILKVTTGGSFTAYSTGVGNAPYHICSGPDGLLWYTRTDDDAICKITTTGTVTTYTSGVPNAPNYICSDGTDLWFTYADGIGKITTSGTVTTYTSGSIDNPQGIALGSDGNLWVTSYDNDRVGVLDPASGVTGPVEFGGTLTVLRNSPESCAIRIGAADGPELLDLTLKRGDNYIQGYMQSDASSTYGLFRTASEDGASITGGIEANAANGDGNKYIILSPRGVTKDTTGVSGISLTTASTEFPFAFSAVNTDTVSGTATLTQSYFSAVNERQRISAR